MKYKNIVSHVNTMWHLIKTLYMTFLYSTKNSIYLSLAIYLFTIMLHIK